MPKFAYVKEGTVKYVLFLDPSTMEKWISLSRSGVQLLESSYYDVFPGDLFIDNNFYKKNEDDTTTLVEKSTESFTIGSIRFAGIMDGEVVGHWGKNMDQFPGGQEEIDEFIDAILTSEIVEISKPEQFIVEKGWLYDGVDFTDPDNV